MVRIGNQNYAVKELWKVKGAILAAILNPKKAMNFAKVKFSEAIRSPKVYGLPYSVFIEPSSYCNLRCPMCLKIQKDSPFDNRNMTLEEYTRVMKELGPTMLTIKFWNYGEGLINKNIYEMIKIAKQYRVFTVLSTNGILMDEEASKRLLEAGLDFLIVSFDGGSKETYEKNRKYGTFEIILKNLQRFMELKKEMKREDNILVSIQFIIMNTNERDVEKIRKISQNLGADKLMLRVLNVVSEKGAHLLPKENQYKKVAGKAKRQSRRQINFCPNVWEETVINSTGVVTACCMDPALEHPFGNIFKEKNFSKIWNGRKYLDFRKKILKDIGTISICNAYCYKKGNRINFIE